MLTTVDKSPCEIPMLIAAVEDALLADRLQRLGVGIGDEIKRLEEDAMISPVRVRGPKGEVLLAAGMASKIIVHHDDGHKTPVLEMNPDEEGHVEGLMCGSALEKGLSVLGIQENDRLKMLHRIPPMEYRAVLDGRHVHLSEGAAAKIWVTTAGRFMQLALAPTGRPLVVERLLGGRRSVGVLESLGLSPGKTITIQEVSPARVAGPHGPCQTVISTSSGLRFYLRPDQARSILVRFPTQDEYENAPKPVMK